MATFDPQLSPLQKLEAGLATLASSFLPKQKVTPPDTYSDDQLIAAKAYLVFAHAEVEDYLETICRAKAQRTLEALVSNGTTCITALTLVAHFGEKIAMCADLAKFRDQHIKLAPEFPNYNSAVTRILLSKLKQAVGSYIEQCRKNHGLKESNLLQLLLPLGVDPLAIDTTWIAEMNLLGTDRGAHAHRGLDGVQQITDPFLSRERMDRILNGPPGSLPPPGTGVVVHSLRSLDVFLAA